MSSSDGHVFTWNEQRAFCRLSRDSNPLHADAVAARRLLYGAPVVHGVHLLLWAMEHAEGIPLSGHTMRKLVCHFQAPVRVADTRVSLSAAQTGAAGWSIQVRSGETIAVNAMLELAANTTDGSEVCRETPPSPPAAPLDLQRDELTSQRGDVVPAVDVATASPLFTRLCASGWDLELSAICAFTEIVGMRCPGRHSIFSGIDATFDPKARVPQAMRYQVNRFDERFSAVHIGVASPWVTATLRAFYRPAAVPQAACSELRDGVSPTAFAGRRALVVGGSRGLGEVAAKLLALGGADVVVTYRVGEADARRVVDDIASSGATAKTLRLDAGDSSTGTELDGDGITDLYYFASPHIGKQSVPGFDARLYDGYCSVYCDALSALVRRLAGSGLKHVFVPSSVFVESTPPGFREYAAAKAACETLCANLAEALGVRFNVPRLPPVQTDQTADLGTPAHLRAEDVLLPLLMDDTSARVR